MEEDSKECQFNRSAVELADGKVHEELEIVEVILRNGESNCKPSCVCIVFNRPDAIAGAASPGICADYFIRIIFFVSE